MVNAEANLFAEHLRIFGIALYGEAQNVGYRHITGNLALCQFDKPRQNPLGILLHLMNLLGNL
ncbi:hypothetical protein D3C75_930620 [compost metagenome]